MLISVCFATVTYTHAISKDHESVVTVTVSQVLERHRQRVKELEEAANKQ